MYHYLYVYFFRVTYNESCLGLYTKNALSSKNIAAEELTLETSLASEWYIAELATISDNYFHYT